MQLWQRLPRKPNDPISITIAKYPYNLEFSDPEASKNFRYHRLNFDRLKLYRLFKEVVKYTRSMKDQYLPDNKKGVKPAGGCCGFASSYN